MIEIVYAYGDKVYSTSGKPLGVAENVIYSKAPQALAKRDKTAVYADSWNIDSEFGVSKTYTAYCYKSRGEWVCKDDSQLSVLRKDGSVPCEDYGYVRDDGKIVGGINCPEIEVKGNVYYKPKTCPNDASKMQVGFNINFHTKLVRNDIYNVKKGDKIKNSDYIVTEEYETAMYYHELGHQKYNTCLKFPTVTKQICGCYSDTTEVNKKIGQERREIELKYKNTLDSMANLFHKKYGEGGYAKTYKCP
jgi:hypothetical protein